MQELQRTPSDGAFRGSLSKFPFSALFDTLYFQKWDGKVVVKNNNHTATVVFKNGECISAQLGSQGGDTVLETLFGWDKGEFIVQRSTGTKSCEQFDTQGEKLKVSSKHRKKKEVKMNVKMVTEAISKLKDDLGDGLIATDIFGFDGQSIGGYNVQPKACALFTQITTSLMKALKGSGFPELGNYYILDLVGGHTVLVIPLGDYQWGMLLDSAKIQMGMLLNIIIPNAIDTFEQAIIS
jgi:hypothetical protein